MLFGLGVCILFSWQDDSNMGHKVIPIQSMYVDHTSPWLRCKRHILEQVLLCMIVLQYFHEQTSIYTPRNEPYIASGGDDGVVKVWDLRQFQRFAEKLPDVVFDCRFDIAVGRQQQYSSIIVAPSLQWNGILLTAVYLVPQERTIKSEVFGDQYVLSIFFVSIRFLCGTWQ